MTLRARGVLSPSLSIRCSNAKLLPRNQSCHLLLPPYGANMCRKIIFISTTKERSNQVFRWLISTFRKPIIKGLKHSENVFRSGQTSGERCLHTEHLCSDSVIILIIIIGISLSMYTYLLCNKNMFLCYVFLHPFTQLTTVHFPLNVKPIPPIGIKDDVLSTVC